MSMRKIWDRGNDLWPRKRSCCRSLKRRGNSGELSADNALKIHAYLLRNIWSLESVFSSIADVKTRVNLIEVYSNNIWWQHKIIFSKRDFTELLINGYSGVVKRWRFENDTQSSTNARECEYPEKEAIQYHRHKLPVFNHLQVERREKNYLSFI